MPSKRGPKPSRRAIHHGDGEIPAPHAWLRPEAAAIFRETARQLDRAGQVEAVDVDLLAAYAVACCALADADAALSGASQYYVGPNGAVCPHPAIKERKSAMDSIARLASLLGIGATARKRNGTLPTAMSNPVHPPTRPQTTDFIRFAQ